MSIRGILRTTAGALVDAGVQIAFQYTSAAAWADFDSDGDLDLLLAGGGANGSLLTQILRNDQTVANTPPSAPSGLSAAVSGAAATLSWNPAADVQPRERPDL